MSASARTFGSGASVLLIGCRGAGKRTLAFLGSLHLRRALVAEDYYFQTVTGLTKSDYVKAHGKKDFHDKTVEVFKQMLEKHSRGCVVACSSTTLLPEAQSVLRALCTTHPVVYVHRERAQIGRLVKDTYLDQFLRADVGHRSCSNLEYFNLLDDSAASGKGRLLAVRDDFSRFLDAVTGGGAQRALIERPFSIEATAPEFRAYSYALRLRLSYVMDTGVVWEHMEGRADCVEFIVDAWPNNVAVLAASTVAWIRRHAGVPIIYHVEEDPRGAPPRKADEKDRMDAQLYEVGLRLGVDYVSVDLQRSETLVMGVLKTKGRVKVLGNYWHTGPQALPWTDDAHVANYMGARALGCDVVRMMRFCSGNVAPELAGQLHDRIMSTVPDPKPPLVVFDFSVLGVRTPLQCRVLNPVKHPAMSDDADFLAGACTYPASFTQLFRALQLQPLRFFVLGADVGYSLSPVMHSVAYDFSGMPHTFRAVPCAAIQDLQTICSSDTFGGASLTAPFKVAVLPHLARWSYHAAAIGAVNVLLPLRGGVEDERPDSSPTAIMVGHANARNRAGPTRCLYGDNTDWSSILVCLRRSLSPRNHVQPSRTTALVVGAGGMARAAIYALAMLGCRRIFVHNRTAAHAEAVAAHFNAWAAGRDARAREARQGQSGSQPQPKPKPQPQPQPRTPTPSNICHVLSSSAEPWPAGNQPPTIVISCVTASGPDPANFEMPPQWLTSHTGGVVMELAYEPLVTPLVAQMRAFHDPTKPPWIVVDGLEIVSEMAVEAFELQTGRMAPKRLMRNVCRRTWEQHQRELRASASSSSNGSGTR